MRVPIRLTVIATVLVALLVLADSLSWATWQSKSNGRSDAQSQTVRVGAGRSRLPSGAGSSAAGSGLTSTSAATAGGLRPSASSLAGGGTPNRPGTPVSVVGANSNGSTSTTTGGGPGGTSPVSQGGSGAPSPPASGTYQVDQSGGFSASVGKPYTYPPVGTLVVEQPDADGQQVWQRYVQSGQAPSDTTLQYGPAGPHILSMSEAGSPCTFPAPGAPAPVWPLRPGERAAATGQCGSGSNTFQLQLVEVVNGTQGYRLPDGATLTVWRIDTSLTITGPHFAAHGTQVDYYSSTYRLPIEEDINLSGTYDGVIHFAYDSKTVLQSTTPTPS